MALEILSDVLGKMEPTAPKEAGMKNLLKMSDLSPAELTHILDVADQLKAQQKLGGTAPLLAGKTVA